MKVLRENFPDFLVFSNEKQKTELKFNFSLLLSKQLAFFIFLCDFRPIPQPKPRSYFFDNFYVLPNFSFTTSERKPAY